MSLATTLDLTDKFNQNGFVMVDVSGWNKIVVQIRQPSGTINFQGTNYSLGDASQATYWETIQGTNLADGTAVTSAAADGIFRFEYITKFLHLEGAPSDTVDALIIYLLKF